MISNYDHFKCLVNWNLGAVVAKARFLRNDGVLTAKGSSNNLLLDLGPHALSALPAAPGETNLQIDLVLQRYILISTPCLILTSEVVALSTNMRTLKFKSGLHNSVFFFAAVIHNHDHKQRTLKHRNTENGSKSINHKSQTMTF